MIPSHNTHDNHITHYGDNHVPDQNQAQRTSVLSINVLLRIPQQNVHVGIDALQGTLVLSLTPLQANDKLGADSASIL